MRIPVSAIMVAVLAGCAATTPVPVVLKKVPHINKETDGNFCMTGTKTILGGIATTPNLYQHAVGKCKHPVVAEENYTVLYFGDEGQQATPEVLAEELDYAIHKGDFLTPTEIAEIDCTEGSECKKMDEFLKKGVSIHFAVDSASPAVESELDELEKLVVIAKKKKVTLLVSGHTDSTYTKSYNATLSLKRAKAVKERLVKAGIPEANITLAWFADDKPVASNESEEGKAKNRRAEVRMADK